MTSQVSGLGPLCYVQLAPVTSISKSSEEGREKDGKTAIIRGNSCPNIATAASPLKASLVHEGVGIAGLSAIGRTGGQELSQTGGSADHAGMYADMPRLTEDVAVGRSDSECSSNSSGVDGASQEDEGKRLVNETRRMLLLHQEHAMTLTELLEGFQRQEEPTNLTIQSLYRQLVGMDGDSKKFEVLAQACL